MPTSYLLRLTLVEPQILAELCQQYNITLTPDRKAVHFIKTDFRSSAETIKVGKEPFIEAKLERIYLPEVLLMKKLWL